MFCDCTARFVWDLVGIPNCWFSHAQAHLIKYTLFLLIDNCAMNSSTDDSSDIHLVKTTLIPRVNDNLISVTTFCGFVDQSYANFYRDWAMIESILCFWAPVLLIISANTATWIKVYRMSRNSLTSRTAQLIRRTRHVLILTTLISIDLSSSSVR